MTLGCNRCGTNYCTCKKSHSKPCGCSSKRTCTCNKCDSGCLNIVYPNCILTTAAYPCLGLAAGKTGTALFSAIDSALCTLNGRSVTVEGCESPLNSGDTISVTASSESEGGAITYTICLGDDTIEVLNNTQTDIEGLLEDLAAIEEDVEDLESCVYDASGNCPEDGEWKTIGGGGNFDDGPAVPAYTATTVGLGTNLQVRKTATGRVAFRGQFELNAAPTNGAVIFTLPVGYRPSFAQPICIFDDTNEWYIVFQTNGQIQAATYSGTPTTRVTARFVEVNVSLD